MDKRTIDERTSGHSLRAPVLAWYALLVTSLPWASLSGDRGANDQGAGEGSALLLLKLAVTLVGLAIAYRRRRPGWAQVGTKLLLGYAAVTALGAVVHGATLSGGLRSARYGLLVLAAAWLASTLGVPRLLRAFVAFAVLLSGSSLMALVLTGDSYSGRLQGWLPPMHPNTLALTAAAGLAATAALASRRELAPRRALALSAVLLTTVLLAQSRSALIAVALAVLVLAVAGDLRRVTAVLVPVAVIGGLFAAYDVNSRADPLSSLMTRGGSSAVDGTFTGRTRAWDRALEETDTTQEWLVGRGLQAKTVYVGRLDVRNQLVDGSGWSAFYQGGLVGLGLLLTALIAASVQALRVLGLAALPLLSLLIVTAWVDSTLNDVFVLLALLSVLAAARAGSETSAEPDVGQRTRMASAAPG